MTKEKLLQLQKRIDQAKSPGSYERVLTFRVNEAESLLGLAIENGKLHELISDDGACCQCAADKYGIVVSECALHKNYEKLRAALRGALNIINRQQFNAKNECRDCYTSSYSSTRHKFCEIETTFSRARRLGVTLESED